MLPRRMSFFGFGRGSRGGLGTEPNSVTRMDVHGDRKPIFDDSTGDAARDGYTRTGRRGRGDQPGEIVSEDVANRIEDFDPFND